MSETLHRPAGGSPPLMTREAIPDTREIARVLYDQQLKARPMLGRGRDPYYYFININHPVIKEIYTRWKDERRIGAYPPTDLERLEFEVGLLNRQAQVLLWERLKVRRETKRERNV